MESGEGCSRFYKNYTVKGKLTLSALGTPSLDYIVAYQEVFEHVLIHLILSDCLSTANVENLNKTRKSFDYFHTMLLCAEHNKIYKLF